jgi:hypothetical protein
MGQLDFLRLCHAHGEYDDYEINSLWSDYVSQEKSVEDVIHTIHHNGYLREVTDELYVQ